MRILQLSDTHNQHARLAELPEADVVVHCGDFTENGTEEEVLDFLNWFAGLPYPHKLFVTGNHDLCLWDAEGIPARRDALSARPWVRDRRGEVLRSGLQSSGKSDS